MFRYLKEAFLVPVSLPGLGALPANAIACTGFFILGFGQPGFWLLGLGLETAYLFSLATNARFQRWVEAKGSKLEETETTSNRDRWLNQLHPDARVRYGQLQKKCTQILQVYQDFQSDAFVVEGNQGALDKLQWIYLKLLVAQNYLLSNKSQTNEKQLQAQIADLERVLRSGMVSPSLKESKEATLKITQQRLENMSRRRLSLEEMDSDLARIEAQVDLALDKASLQGQPALISGDIDLATHLLDDAVYNDLDSTTAALEQTYEAPKPTPQ